MDQSGTCHRRVALRRLAVVEKRLAPSFLGGRDPALVLFTASKTSPFVKWLRKDILDQLESLEDEVGFREAVKVQLVASLGIALAREQMLFLFFKKLFYMLDYLLTKCVCVISYNVHYVIYYAGV